MKTKKLTPEAINGKIVVIRVDFNVPIENNEVTETTRIEESLPTLNFLIQNGAKRIHILSHLGRPKDAPDPKFSLKIVHPILQKLLEKPVEFREDFSVGISPIQLHENVRFSAGEKKNDPRFIEQLLSLGGEVFINDGFAVSHRAHASVVGLASYLPSYPGFLLQKEIEHLSPFLSTEKIQELTVIIGGAKIETKVKVLEHFCKTAGNVIIGGALANTFLAAQGCNIGRSLSETEQIPLAQKILQIAAENKTGIHLPIDVVCAEELESSEQVMIPIEDVLGNMKIFDIGAHTIESYQEILKHSKTIIWNGPVGVFEIPAFANGTRAILKTIAAQKYAQTILGGGDTLDALKKFGVSKDSFSHVSTGGGAMLKFLEGRELPGIEVLKN